MDHEVWPLRFGRPCLYGLPDRLFYVWVGHVERQTRMRLYRPRWPWLRPRALNRWLIARAPWARIQIDELPRGKTFTISDPHGLIYYEGREVE